MEPAEEAPLSTRPSRQSTPVRVTVVESAGCHYCEDAHAALEQLAHDGHALEVRTLDLREPEGHDLMRRHGAAVSPLVLVDDTFFSQGRLPRGKLARLLAGSTRAASTPTGA